MIKERLKETISKKRAAERKLGSSFSIYFKIYKLNKKSTGAAKLLAAPVELNHIKIQFFLQYILRGL